MILSAVWLVPRKLYLVRMNTSIVVMDLQNSNMKLIIHDLQCIRDAIKTLMEYEKLNSLSFAFDPLSNHSQNLNNQILIHDISHNHKLYYIVGRNNRDHT